MIPGDIIEVLQETKNEHFGANLRKGWKAEYVGPNEADPKCGMFKVGENIVTERLEDGFNLAGYHCEAMKYRVL